MNQLISLLPTICTDVHQKKNVASVVSTSTDTLTDISTDVSVENYETEQCQLDADYCPPILKHLRDIAVKELEDLQKLSATAPNTVKEEPNSLNGLLQSNHEYSLHVIDNSNAWDDTSQNLSLSHNFTETRHKETPPSSNQPANSRLDVITKQNKPPKKTDISSNTGSSSNTLGSSLIDERQNIIIQNSTKSIERVELQTKLKKDKSHLRKGKWTVEEEEYTERIIHYFRTGLLTLPESTTLRSYLAEKLSCDPMRITKKYSGASCLGKRVHHLCTSSHKSEAEIEMAKNELFLLESRFLCRVEYGKSSMPLPPNVRMRENMLAGLVPTLGNIPTSTSHQLLANVPSSDLNPSVATIAAAQSLNPSVATIAAAAAAQSLLFKYAAALGNPIALSKAPVAVLPINSAVTAAHAHIKSSTVSPWSTLRLPSNPDLLSNAYNAVQPTSQNSNLKNEKKLFDNSSPQQQTHFQINNDALKSLAVAKAQALASVNSKFEQSVPKKMQKIKAQESGENNQAPIPVPSTTAAIVSGISPPTKLSPSDVLEIERKKWMLRLEESKTKKVTSLPQATNSNIISPLSSQVMKQKTKRGNKRSKENSGQNKNSGRYLLGGYLNELRKNYSDAVSKSLVNDNSSCNVNSKPGLASKSQTMLNQEDESKYSSNWNCNKVNRGAESLTSSLTKDSTISSLSRHPEISTKDYETVSSMSCDTREPSSIAKTETSSRSTTNPSDSCGGETESNSSAERSGKIYNVSGGASSEEDFEKEPSCSGPMRKRFKRSVFTSRNIKDHNIRMELLRTSSSALVADLTGRGCNNPLYEI